MAVPKIITIDGATQSKPVPRSRYEYTDIAVGDLRRTPLTKIRAGCYEALLVSEPHWKVYPPKRAKALRISRTGKYYYARRPVEKGGWKWSGGGPFYVYRRTVDHGTGNVRSVLNAGIRTDYNTQGVVGKGGFTFSVPDQPASWSEMENDLKRHYATGYSRARPGNPVASLGQFLIELRDRPRMPFRSLFRRTGGNFSTLPRILKNELSGFKNLGSEYLNVQFGWMPFVKDLRQMYNLWKTIDARIAQIIRDNNRDVRRRATVLNESTVSTYGPIVYNYPYANCYGGIPNWSGGRTVYTVDRVVKRRVWFSGSFRYFISDVGSVAWNARARLALFGAFPTPELLWEVLPWSWLVDWFSNVGAIASNFSMNAVENLTCAYSYVMSHTTETITATAVVHQPSFYQKLSGKITQYDLTDHAFFTSEMRETKCRTGGGNPFGLDVHFSDLTNRQVGILAALGLSRSDVR